MRILVLILPMVVYSRWLDTVLYSNVFFRKIQNIFKRKLFNAFTVVAIAIVVVFIVATVKYYDDNQSFLFHTLHWWFTDQHKLWLILINMHVNNILKAENKRKNLSHSHTYSHQFISWKCQHILQAFYIFSDKTFSKSISWNESAQ